MLDTIREYGAEELAASGGEADVRNRFITRYLSMARYFGEHVVDDDQLDRFRELQREHANLGAALGYTLDATDGNRYRDGAELAIDLYGYWHMAGLLREGKYWLDKVLERFPDPSSSERGWALVVRGYLGAMQGEAAEAVADATAGTKIGEQRGDPKLVGRGYCYLTLALTIADRYEEARAAGAQAEQRLQRLNDRAGLRILDVHLAHVAQLSGDPEGALRYAAQVTRRFGEGGETGEIKERWAQGWAYAISAMAMYWDPAPGTTRPCQTTSKALLAKHELGDVMGMAYCLEIHGWLAARAGRHVRAAWLLGAADPLWERAGGRLGGTAALLSVHDGGDGQGPGGVRAASASTRCSPRPDGTRSTSWSRSRSATPTSRPPRAPGGGCPGSSPSARPRSPTSRPGACPTGRSRSTCSSPSAPSTRTLTTFTPSSGSPRGLSCSTRSSYVRPSQPGAAPLRPWARPAGNRPSASPGSGSADRLRSGRGCR